MSSSSSFLGLEGLHVFVTGAAGGVGEAVCKEFLVNGCKVAAFDRRPIDQTRLTSHQDGSERLLCVTGDLKDEGSIQAAFNDAKSKFGPVQILIANAGITDESVHTPIWELSANRWDEVNTNNVKGTFLTIKHFLRQVKDVQESTHAQLDNVSIVVTGSETGVFGQELHAEYATGKAGLQYGLVKTVKNEIIRLNAKARINAVAPGWINTPLIGDRLDDPRELWAEAQATVALKKIAQPEDVARCMAFLSSHRAAGHITGQCVSVDGGQEGRLLWKEDQILGASTQHLGTALSNPVPTAPMPPRRRRRMRICLSVDFDAISGYLGTGHVPENTLADYSAGIFSANVGVYRLLRLFAKHEVSDKVAWFIPGHSLETFPEQTASIVASGAEIGLHGYSHEGAYAMTPEQEKDVIEKCIELVTKVQNGRRPVGYRAPLYQIRETTVKLLQEHDFLYDSSMNAHDSLPYYLPNPFTWQQPQVPDYTRSAASWMKPTEMPRQPEAGTAEAKGAMIEIPASWYTEDMTPLGFYPYTASTQGYVSVDVVEKIWWDRFEWLWENESWLDDGPGKGYGSIYPMIWHPESAGRSHIVAMIDRFIGKLVGRMLAAHDGEITFETMESVALSWKQR
ncbi:glucose 1-dehydrogenase [Xylariales sp. AK1849]|nr:glucose 1-dehydrogenase [Xylariales sp. AK1849]